MDSWYKIQHVKVNVHRQESCADWLSPPRSWNVMRWIFWNVVRMGSCISIVQRILKRENTWNHQNLPVLIFSYVERGIGSWSVCGRCPCHNMSRPFIVAILYLLFNLWRILPMERAADQAQGRAGSRSIIRDPVGKWVGGGIRYIG